MKKHFAFFIFVIAVIAADAQTTFQRVYSNISQFRSVQQTTDGGYIVAGYHSPQACLLKLDANANTLWSKTFGGNGSRSFTSVKQTTDGGYIAAGNILPSGSSYSKIYLVRTDANGDTLWTRNYGGASSDQANSVKQTADGGFIIAGATDSYGSGTHAYVLKTDANGNIAWTKTFASPGAANTESFSEIQNTNDGGLIITGTSGYTANHEILVIKLDSVGDTIWSRGFFYNAGGMADNPVGKSVIQTSDGGYIVLGSMFSSMFGGAQMVLLKLNSAGTITWSKTFIFTAGILSNYIYFYSIRQAPDGGYLISGSVEQGTLMTNIYALLIRTDVNGDTLWTKNMGINSYIYDIDRTSDGGFIVTGNTSSWGSGAYLITIDSLGNAACDEGSISFTIGNSAPAIYKGQLLGSGGLVSGAPATVGTLDTAHTNPCLPIPSICMVTVDSLTQKNMVIWEKNIDTSSVATYNIYKETTVSGVYALIGNVANSSLSTFIDYASIPAQKADRYKITTVDTYGIEAYTKSAAHKTIHLSINLGVPPQKNLIWENYEGFTVNTYRIWRGNAGGMHLIDSVQGTLFSYSDLTPPAQDTVYFIEALHTPCQPTAKGVYSSTKSNFVVISIYNGITDIENTFSIYPNPCKEKITIEKSNISQDAVISIYNIQGQLLLQHPMQYARTELDISNLDKGFYFVKILNPDMNIVKKIIKE